jgi:hypothetical protein
LISKLQGTPRQLIQHLIISNDNLATVKIILEDKYGDRQTTVDFHTNQLMSIQPIGNNPAALEQLLDHVTGHMHALSRYDVEVSDYALFFYPKLLGSLPSDIAFGVSDPVITNSTQKVTSTLRAEQLKALLTYIKNQVSRRADYIQAQSNNKSQPPAVSSRRAMGNYYTQKPQFNGATAAFPIAAAQQPPSNQYYNSN